MAITGLELIDAIIACCDPSDYHLTHAARSILPPIGKNGGCPNPTGAECEIEIRQIMEMSDFGDEMTPKLKEKEMGLRAQSEQLTKAAKR